MKAQLLINLTDSDLRRYAPVNVNTSIEALTPHFSMVEQKYIIPLLGRELFNQLIEIVKHNEISGSGSDSNSNSDSTIESEVDTTTLFHTLYDKVMFAAIHLVFHEGYSLLSVSFSDAGASSLAGDGKRLYRYQEEKLQSYFKNMGFDQIDGILDFINENISIFNFFKHSKFYEKAQKTLIPTTAIFNDTININNSRLVFLKMKYYTDRVEDIDLHGIVGDNFFNELLKIKPEDTHFLLLKHIRSYIVYAAMAYGVSELKKNPTEKGLIFEIQNSDGYQVEQVEDAEMLKTIIYHQTTAQRYLNAAIHYLNQHKKDFPTYFEYAGETEKENIVYKRDNNNKKTFWM